MSLLTKVIACIVLLILLISGGFNVYQAFEVHSLNKNVTDLKDVNDTLTTNLKNCNGSLATQNADVKQAQADASQKQTDLDSLGKTLADQQKKNLALITQLSSQQAPKTCQEAQDYLKKNLELYTW